MSRPRLLAGRRIGVAARSLVPWSLVLLLCGLSSSPAQAQSQAPVAVQQNIDPIAMHTYGHSPIAPPSLPDPNNVLTELEDAERVAKRAENQAARNLVDDLVTTARKAKLARWVKAGSIVSLAATVAIEGGPCVIKHGYKFWKCFQGSEAVPTYELMYYGADPGSTIQTPFNSGWWTVPPEGAWLVRYRKESASTSIGSLTSYTDRALTSGKLPECAVSDSYIPSTEVWNEATGYGNVTRVESWSGSYTKNFQPCSSYQEGHLVVASPEAVLGDATPTTSAPQGARIIDIGPGPADPGPDSVRAALLEYFASAEGQDLAAWYDWALGTPGAINPYTGERNPIRITIPSCDGLTFDACAQRLRNAGFTGTVNRQNETFEGADVTKPADAVLALNPSAGAQVDDTGEIILTTNPADADMPRVIPAIVTWPGEVYETYADRLTGIDLVANRSDAAEANWEFGPNVALTTDPAPGTRVRRDSEVRVKTNPRSECERYPRSDPGTGPTNKFFITDVLGTDPVTGSATVVDPTTGSARSINLHWGEKAWGYRHISIGHGWGPDDRGDADRALRTDAGPLPDPTKATAFRYYYMYVDSDGRQCTRKVLVDFAHQGEELRPRDIITSYAYPGWQKR